MSSGEDKQRRDGVLDGMRVLIGPDDIASFCTRLARGLAKGGARCWLYNSNPHQYTAGAEQLGAAKLWAPGWTARVARLKTSGIAGRLIGAVLTGLLRWAVFVWSLWAIDAVVFVYNRSLLRGNIDLWIYQRLGKRVIRVFLGSDSRPRYMDGWHHDLLVPGRRARAARALARRARRQHRRVRRLSRWSDVVVENPLCGHFQARPFVNWFRVGIPHDPAAFGELPAPEPVRALRVLHCPSNPEIKGTKRIECAIEELRTHAADLEYTKITGMPRAEVLRRLGECEVVIDELYSDSPMPAFASEAAAFGKAAILCGYGWDVLRRSMPEHAMPPTFCYDPAEFESVLPRLIADRRMRAQRGLQAFEFVNGYWHQDAVVERFSVLLEANDAIPEDWWCDPAQIGYWQGLGAPAEHRRAAITALCELQGIEALMVAPGSPLRETVASWREESSAGARHQHAEIGQRSTS